MIKNKNLSISELILSIFKFKTFEKSFSSKLLIIYNLVLLFVIALISLVSNNIGNYPIYGNLDIFLFMLFGLPVVLGTVYGMFYIFLNAYEIKRKTFFSSYLVFLSTLLPFVLVGNLLNIIDKIILIPQVTLAFGFVLLIFSIWFLFVFVNTFKYYYNISRFKIVSSIILVFVFNLALITLQYLSYLISVLN